MDKIPVDTSKANGATAWLTLTALLLHAAKYPALQDDVTDIEVDWWQHVGIRYTSADAASAAEQVMQADTTLLRGSVLWTTPKVLTVSLRERVTANVLAQAYPPGVLSVTVDERGVGISRIEGTRLPAVWQRFGRVELCDALNVQLAWLAKPAV